MGFTAETAMNLKWSIPQRKICVIEVSNQNQCATLINQHKPLRWPGLLVIKKLLQIKSDFVIITIIFSFFCRFHFSKCYFPFSEKSTGSQHQGLTASHSSDFSSSA